MQLVCGHCGQGVEVTPKQAGRSVSCPHCGRDVRVPKLTDDDSTVSLAETTDIESGYANVARQVTGQRVRFACGRCGKVLILSARLSGHKRNCPACGTRLAIPYPEDDTDVLPSSTKASRRQLDEGTKALRLAAHAQKSLASAGRTAKRQPDQRSLSGWLCFLILLLVCGIIIAIVHFKYSDKQPTAVSSPVMSPAETQPTTTATTLPLTGRK